MNLLEMHQDTEKAVTFFRTFGISEISQTCNEKSNGENAATRRQDPAERIYAKAGLDARHLCTSHAHGM